jgi:putative ABC transport system substrate-binding protein
LSRHGFAGAERAMDRRTFLGTAAGALAGLPTSHASAASPVRRVGMLFPVDVAATNTASLRDALQQLGYVDGSNVAFVVRSADGRIERLPELARELVRQRVDIIVTGGSEATQAAKQATTAIPIVFSGPSYPIEEGLVETFARPGGNITGITIAMSDTVAKHLQLLREVTFFVEHVDQIRDAAAALRIASISIAKRFTERGLLMSYGADFRDAPRRVAAYVDRILKGAKPGDLPVERPTRFEFAVNLRTARALGITIPKPLLLRAETRCISNWVARRVSSGGQVAASFPSAFT